MINRFLKDESGATAIEYGLIIAMIAVGIIAASSQLSGALSDLFVRLSNHLDNAV